MAGESRYVAAGNHVMKKLVAVVDGEVLRGDRFPLGWTTAPAPALA